MKKTLLATSALAFAGALAAGQAAAADRLSVGLGGYMEQWVGITNLDNGDGGIAQWSDSEFNVRGSLEADNGLKFSVKIEVEGNTSSDQIDESQATVSGSFGQIVLGSEDQAPSLMHAGHQDVGIGLNHGDVGWLSGISTGGTHGHFSDEQRISYYSPVISGVQLGASYTPDMGSEDTNRSPTDNDMSAWAASVNVTQQLGDASVRFSLGHYVQSRAQTAFMTMTGMDANGNMLVGDADLHPAAFDNRKADLMAFDGALEMDDNGHYMGAENLTQLAMEADRARTLLGNAMATKVMAGGDYTFTNAGLQVGLGAFGFNVAYATKEGGAYTTMMYVDPGMDGQLGMHPRGRYLATNADGMYVDGEGEVLPASELNSAGVPASNDNKQRSMVVKDTTKDADITTIGVIYTDGPMAASAGYLLNERGDGMETEAVMVSFRYTLAPGIDSKTSIFSADNGTDAGTGFVTGITLGF